MKVKANKNPYRGIKIGFFRNTGEYVAFVNSKELVSPNRVGIERLIDKNLTR